MMQFRSLAILKWLSGRVTVGTFEIKNLKPRLKLKLEMSLATEVCIIGIAII